MFPLFSKKARAGAAIHLLRINHCSECERLHATAFAKPWKAPEFERLFLASTTVAEGAFVGSQPKLAGFAISRLVLDEAEILTITVDQQHRRSGIARSLLSAHIGRISGLGGQKIFLEVDEHNSAAIGLYMGFGFYGVGKRASYYQLPNGEAADALIFRLDLT